MDKVFEFAADLFSRQCVAPLRALVIASPFTWTMGIKEWRPALAPNTAISFTTNTNWQNYPGESALGHAGLAGSGVQAVASCAVGTCVAVALIRGLAQYQEERIGNSWVDPVRTVVRVLRASGRFSAVT
jgi:K+-transporting ATPase ATPase A chain